MSSANVEGAVDGVYRRRVQGQSLSIAIVEAVADARGEDPTSASFVLADHVDPDALDALYDGPSEAWEFEFALEGHAVHVASEGIVSVESR